MLTISNIYIKLKVFSIKHLQLWKIYVIIIKSIDFEACFNLFT